MARPLAGFGLLALAPVALLPLVAQEIAGTAGLKEEQRVTAVDVLVELDADLPSARGESRSLPKQLEPRDFVVRVDGEPQQVVGYLDPRADRPAQAPAAEEPWRVVLYFDLELAQRDTVRWAAAELAEMVPQLAAFGPVELVVAKDEETRRLAPTQDLELLVNELAGLAISPSGAHRAIELRAEVLDALRENPAAFEQEEGIGRELVEQEVAFVESRLDDLLLELTDRAAPSAKRALFWITDGFDLEPENFYRAEGVEVEPLPKLLLHRSAKFSVTLASYGWVAFALTPPAADAGLVPGFRIGKWLFGAPREGPFFLRLTREERRDPDIADGHYQLGLARLAAGEPEEAESEFERALYHFAGDPRTAKRQASAKLGLGRALEAQGEPAQARQAFRHAIELDPDLAGEIPQTRPRLLDALEFERALASATAGRLVETPEELDEAVASMSRRARLTYQVAGLPLGEVRKLEVARVGSDSTLRHPLWTRSGVPSGVPAARARRLLRGETEDGTLPVKARLSSKAGEAHSVFVDVDPRAMADSDSGEDFHLIRITAANGTPDGLQSVRYRRFELPRESTSEDWSFRVPLDGSAPGELVAVVVEVLESGRWGGALAD